MKTLTDEEANQLQKNIEHILDSGPNSIRLLDMIDLFLSKRNEPRISELEKAMQWFVDRCDNGEVRSRKTYDRFKELLKNK